MAGPLYWDSVCENSSTKGTGAFSLSGPTNAPAGDVTFASKGMAAGDTFYYSALNVDNPTQLEVGMGTWRADGKIDRSSTNGQLVDFTSGTKRVCLIQLAPRPVTLVGGASSSGGLTDTQLRASPVPVTISGTLAVSGPLTNAELRATALPVSGPATNAELRATPLPISGTVTANVPNGLDVDVLTLPSLPAGANAIGSVSVSNFPATQPISGSVSVSNFPASQPVTGPLTDTQLRASAVPVSLSSTTITGTVAVSGPLTDTQLRASAVPVSGTFFQATQPVSIAATVNVAGPLTDAQLRASAVPVSLTSTTITGTVAVTAPTLTKGTQSANGWSVQPLRDAGRACICLTAEFTFAQVAETMLTLTKSVDGGNTTTGTSFVISNGKKFRIQSISGIIETLGSGTAPQRAYLRLRRNTAGATVVGSNIQGVWGFANSAAIVKSAMPMDYEVPEAMEMAGDGTATFGFSLETPDWVTSTATGRIKLTIIGYEY